MNARAAISGEPGCVIAQHNVGFITK